MSTDRLNRAIDKAVGFLKDYLKEHPEYDLSDCNTGHFHVFLTEGDVGIVNYLNLKGIDDMHIIKPAIRKLQKMETVKRYNRF